MIFTISLQVFMFFSVVSECFSLTLLACLSQEVRILHCSTSKYLQRHAGLGLLAHRPPGHWRCGESSSALQVSRHLAKCAGESCRRSAALLHSYQLAPLSTE